MSEEKKQEAITDKTKKSVPEPETTESTTVSKDDTVNTDVSTDAPADDTKDSQSKQESKGSYNNNHKHSQSNQRNPRRPRRGGRRQERPRQEFDQKIVSIRRVTRVMAGGRRFSFSVSMVIGDKKGRVGVGIGKAGDTQLAIEKSIRNAKKNMITVLMNKDGHIPHDVHVKFASSEVMMMPAPGRGLVAGSSVRTVLELAGVKDITAKIFSRSKNKLNNAKAAIEALKQLKA